MSGASSSISSAPITARIPRIVSSFHPCSKIGANPGPPWRRQEPGCLVRPRHIRWTIVARGKPATTFARRTIGGPERHAKRSDSSRRRDRADRPR